MTTKRIAAGLLAAVMALGLVSCGEGNERSNGGASGEVSESSTDENKYTAEFEFAQSILGMDAEAARELLKNTYPDTEEQRVVNMTPVIDATMYANGGSLEFLGERFDAVSIEADNTTGKVAKVIYVVGKKQEDRPTKKIYEALLEKISSQYGEYKADVAYPGSPSEKTTDEWEDDEVCLSYTEGQYDVYLSFGNSVETDQKQYEDKQSQGESDGSSESKL